MIVFSARGWMFPVLALLVALAAALVWAGHRGAVERRIRIGCGLLKLVGVLTLALCLLEPIQLGQRARPGANLFALMVDESQSLRVKDAGQLESRGDVLRRQLTNDTGGWQTALEEAFQVRRYTFDSHLQDVHDFGGLEFDGNATALEHALHAAAERWRGQPVAGVLVFTDGNATDASPELAALGDCPPVYPVVLGSDSGLRDIALDKVSVSQTAFEDAPVTVEAEITAHGFAGSDVNARLLEVTGGASNVVAQQAKPARDGESALNFRFQIQPDKPGLHFYQVETRAREELGGAAADSHEATLANNRQIVVVDRGQEPFRVLFVGGRMDWEYKFLKRALSDDAQVHVVGLIRVAKREPKFDFRGNAGESSNPLFKGFGQTDDETARYDQPVVIRDNVEDEFELRGNFPKTAEELFRYHAVIVDKVEAEFFTHDQMVLLQRFVSERGGGFAMLGGAESFHQGNYAGTVIASLLPVYLDRPAAPKLPSKWKFNLTPEGLLEPWTRLRSTEAEETERLQSMQPLSVFNPVGGVKPGASVLATVSDEDNANLPALVVQRFGFGRSAALMIGDMYHWGSQSQAAQKDLAKSWRQLVRWLVSDVLTRVAVHAETGADGDPARVRLVVKVRDEEYKPLDNASVQLSIRPVQLSQGAPTHDVPLTADASPNQPGTYVSDYIATEAGASSVEAVATQSDGKVIGRAAAGWALDPAAAEFRSLKPNRAYLEALAMRTGGQVLTLDGLRDFVRQLPQRHAPIMEAWSKPLWQEPAVFLFALACFVAEWGIRRWKGLP
ncbi:MAG TPA: glutamine amidotransferase [Candidatus Cybelea sp.]|nr:glutamine amidotransferase [Candidatus Cybelea sp.]